MKNILLDHGLRVLHILYIVKTAILASVKNYSIKQMKKRMVNIFSVISNCGFCFY